MKNLKTLDVEENKITTLPVEALQTITSLKKLSLKHNPIAELMSNELLDSSAEQILEKLNYKQTCLALQTEVLSPSSSPRDSPYKLVVRSNSATNLANRNSTNNSSGFTLQPFAKGQLATIKEQDLKTRHHRASSLNLESPRGSLTP